MGSLNWINIVVVLVLTALAVAFATANLEPVQIRFFGAESPSVPLYVPVFLAFLLGFGGGLFAMSFSRRKHKREIARLRAEHEALSREVENLRNIPLQDDL